MTPGPRRSPGPRLRSRSQVRTYGESAAADYRVTDVLPRGMATRLTVTPGVQLEIAVPGGTTR